MPGLDEGVSQLSIGERAKVSKTIAIKYVVLRMLRQSCPLHSLLHIDVGISYWENLRNYPQ